MRKILILTCGILMMSSVAMAEGETTVETCAGGSGTIVIGAISKHKYCKSNKPMTWWNAHAWCDALKRRLFSMDDCGCNGVVNCNNICPELRGAASDQNRWTASPSSTTHVYTVGFYGENIYKNNRDNSHNVYAVCW